MKIIKKDNCVLIRADTIPIIVILGIVFFGIIFFMAQPIYENYNIIKFNSPLN